jgi:hypothetical protein
MFGRSKNARFSTIRPSSFFWRTDTKNNTNPAPHDTNFASKTSSTSQKKYRPASQTYERDIKKIVVSKI